MTEGRVRWDIVNLFDNLYYLDRESTGRAGLALGYLNPSEKDDANEKNMASW